MDKETLSNYGWIVICVLVLSIMIALATPFGTFISNAVQNTTEGLFKTEQNAMEEGLKAAGVELEDVEFDGVATVGGNNIDDMSNSIYGKNDPNLNHNGTVPEGGTYYSGLESIPFVWFCNGCGNFVAGREEDGIYNSEGVKIKEEDITGCCEGYGTYHYDDYGPKKLESFPNTPQKGDVYIYGDYVYHYNGCNCNSRFVTLEELEELNELMNYEECYDSDCWGEQNGLEWHVVVADKNATEYDIILESIGGEPITSLAYTFNDCKNMVTSPEIPPAVTNLNYTFYGCASLKVAPAIKGNFKGGLFDLYDTDVRDSDMSRTFGGCTSLEATPVLPDSIISMSDMFSGCTSLKTITNFPKNVRNLYCAFCDCTSLVNVPHIPDGVYNMFATFAGCTSLSSVPNLPRSLRGLSAYAFAGCTSLTSLPPFNDIIEDIHSENGCFETMHNLPDSVKVLNFYDCDNLKIIPNFPQGMENIVLYSCDTLNTIPTIPSSVTYLSLSSCHSLTGEIEINTDIIEHYGDIFSDIDFQAQKINLTGSSMRLDEYGATGHNYCANCNGYCSCGNYTH